MSISSKPFGNLPSGETAQLFTLTNTNGLSAEITNYGGIIVSLSVPDRDGMLEDILLGKDNLQGYLDGHPHFACITGRAAGRIGKGQFSLDGIDYQLAINNGPNALHGGERGYDKLLWNAEVVTLESIEKLRLSITDHDGNNHFPGTIRCVVTYALLDDDSLEICYEATTDKTTPFNITNHAYFNLKGQGKGDVLGHTVQIFADSIAAVDEDSTLVGRRDAVRAGFNDYREPVKLGELDELVVENADIHFFLHGGRTTELKPAAIVSEPESGRVMEVLTTEPGVQFYAGLSLSEEGPEVGKNGIIHKPLDGFCLETQDYADSVNFPEMGGAILRPGDRFQSKTVFRFSVK